MTRKIHVVIEVEDISLGDPLAVKNAMLQADHPLVRAVKRAFSDKYGISGGPALAHLDLTVEASISGDVDPANNHISIRILVDIDGPHATLAEFNGELPREADTAVYRIESGRLTLSELPVEFDLELTPA